MEELVGLEPTHTGFAIRGITSFAIAPSKCKYIIKNDDKSKWFFVNYINGREQGIRTLGGVNLAGFQNRYIRPTLSTLYIIISGANGRNWTDTLKPELDFKSNASTYSATLALLLVESKKLCFLNWTGIIIDLGFFVKGFFENF